MNMGILDRIIRGIVGVALMVVALFVLDGAWQIVLIVLGGILVGTALSGFCPIYVPFHISTKK
ncbi:MAG: DUF2892 domain-containing protein [Dehalococcoidales bacterium]|jgi:uncharacterized membrane protein|nr:DUF2892 domain-containing protein [Dehalococcoidales bacterium]